MSLLTSDLRYDRRAIMRAAHAEARRKVARLVDLGLKARFADQFRFALAAVWSDARTELWCAKRDAKLAAMPAPVARLTEARAAAVHIDATCEMLATLAAIDAQLASLQVAA